MIVQRRLAGKPSMTPLEIIRRAQDGTLIDEDGEFVTLELFPGLSNTELQEFANHLPCRIPPSDSGVARRVEMILLHGRTGRVQRQRSNVHALTGNGRKA